MGDGKGGRVLRCWLWHAYSKHRKSGSPVVACARYLGILHFRDTRMSKLSAAKNAQSAEETNAADIRDNGLQAGVSEPTGAPLGTIVGLASCTKQRAEKHHFKGRAFVL